MEFSATLLHGSGKTTNIGSHGLPSRRVCFDARCRLQQLRVLAPLECQSHRASRAFRTCQPPRMWYNRCFFSSRHVMQRYRGLDGLNSLSRLVSGRGCRGFKAPDRRAKNQGRVRSVAFPWQVCKACRTCNPWVPWSHSELVQRSCKKL